MRKILLARGNEDSARLRRLDVFDSPLLMQEFINYN